MALIIPLNPLPSQTINIQLGGQNCQINVYQKNYGLFFDLFVNNTSILAGALCQNLNRLVRSLYLGFVGDFTFLDNQGTNDPVYTGLGSRYSLVYLEAVDIVSWS